MKSELFLKQVFGAVLFVLLLNGSERSNVFAQQGVLKGVFTVNTTGIINGIFSVGDNTGVCFSQGNLQYQASTNTWQFAEKQWDYVGSDNNNISSSDTGWIDLFGWGTSGYNHGAVCYQPWSISTSASDYYAYGNDTYSLNDQTGQADWGYNAISNGGNAENSGLRTLTNDEWYYLFNTRVTASGIRYAKANVNNVNGVILLPDDWQTSYYSLNSTNASYDSFSTNVITAAQWATLEQYGAVFLPAAGSRNGTSVSNVGSYGDYWSASYNDGYDAYYVNFDDGYLNASYDSRRYYGLSVRLVRSVEDYSFDINAVTIPAEGGTVSGAGAYMAGAGCTLTATASAGFHFAYWTQNGRVVAEDADYTFTVGNNRDLVANFAPDTTTGRLNGVFSLGENSSVMFSQGNLQYRASTDTWFFAENQWDYVGADNRNVSETNTGLIDLFGWGTSGYNHGANCYQPWSTSTSSSDYYVYDSSIYNLYDQTGLADWGYNAISNGGDTENSGWRTLTNDEWYYLFNTRVTASGIRYAKANVNNVNGVILLPDDWDDSYYTLNNPNGGNYSSNIITASQWATLEQYGAVFLSTSGDRNGTSIFNVGSCGYYWSASYNNSSYAYCVYFSDGSFDLNTSNHSYRYYGHSVRLVRPAEDYSFGINAVPNPAEGGTVSGAGSYMAGAECTLTATASAGYHFAYWTQNGRVVSMDATYTFTVGNNRDLVANFAPDTTTGRLNGIFTTGENSSVMFSQGNLQYRASTNTWRFAENQWDYVGPDNSNISETYTGLIDLFGFGTSGYNHGATCYQPWSTSTNNDDYYAYGSSTYNLNDQTGKADWGYNAISNGGNRENIGWRTLTNDEWDYLFNTRVTASNIRYAKANVNNINGVILLPDDWQLSYYSLNGTNTPNASFTANVITAAQWATLEQHGAVFLPAAGGRYGTSVYNFGSYGRYWSASHNGSNTYSDSYYVIFSDGYLNASYNSSRYSGYSVRLVHPIYSVNAIPMPAEGGVVSGAGAYMAGDTCTLIAVASEGYAFSNWTENGSVVSTEATYAFTVTSNRLIIANFHSCHPMGFINGLFSVGENIGVLFSQGNLQYQASTNIWQFATNQYDYIGCYNSSVSSSYNGWIDLFGWSTSGYVHGANCYHPWSISTTNSAYYAYGNSNCNLYDQTGQADWGYNAISNGGNAENSGWRTLTKDEWDYLFNTRTTSSGIRYAKAMVNGINGVILLPDDWQSSYYSLNSANTSNASFSANVITDSQWATLEQHGAVFLPAAGYRNGTSVSRVGSRGYYWAASIRISGLAYYMYFYDGNINASNSDYLYYGQSVRLVRPAENYSINAVSSPAEGGTVSGIGSYLAGAECTLTATASEGYHFAYWTKNGRVVSADADYTFTVGNNLDFVANFAPDTTTGRLNGMFTTGENSSVMFSQGNLQYRASTDTWRFAENQWDYVGPDNSNISETYTGLMDLFGWGTSGFDHGAVCYHPWSTSTSDSAYYAYGSDSYNLYDQTGMADWGYNAISNGGNTENSGWRTLTNDEWVYLFNTRVTASNIRYAKANVNNINGVILLPDDWQLSYYSLNGTNNPNASFTANVITAAQWVTLEQHGAVFLPAAGYRNGTSVSNVGSYGNYWSASYNSSYSVYGVYFSDEYRYLYASYSNYRYYGQSVRLVRPVEDYSFDINAGTIPAEGGTVSGAGVYMAGAGCTLTATASAGFHFAYWTQNGRVVAEDAAYTFTVGNNRDLVANFAPDTTTGRLNGVFSLGENSSVMFSQGNLQYRASTDTWFFAENQWDYVGADNRNVSETNTGLIDLFGWGTSGYNHGANCYQPWSTSTSSSDYYVYDSSIYNLYDQTGLADWGYNAISNGGDTENSGWRTLTKEEWDYLFNTRSTSSGIRYAKAMVNCVSGVILLPDDWQTSYYSLNSTNASYASFSTNVMTAAQWATLEQHGAVFLSTSGDRNGTSVGSVGSFGYYWSASCNNNERAYYVSFGEGNIDANNNYYRYYGQSVRLVRPAEDYSFGINAVPNPAEGGTVSGAGSYLAGAECTLTATASEDYHFAYWTQNGRVVSMDATYTFTVGNNRDLVANFSPDTTTGRLNGIFTTSENSSVMFSQGNLQYRASTNTWRFAENQWDYVGPDNSNISETYTGLIDLFGFGTSGFDHGAVCCHPWSTSTSSSDYYVYGSSNYNLNDSTGVADWGYNAISNGGSTENSGWRTLTNEEWDYLFNTRSTSSGIRYAKAMVNGINGVILLSDDWLSSYYSLNSANTSNASFSANVITASQWATLEQHGAVFLPAAGYRSGTTVSLVCSFGFYWSSSYGDSDGAYEAYFGDGYYFNANNSVGRYYGQSVRLVRPSENCSFGINVTPNPAEGGTVTIGTETTGEVFLENFEHLTVGNNIAEEALTSGNECWTTWGNAPGGPQDGVVAVFDGTQCAHFTYGNDQVLLLGNNTTGAYELSFDMYIPEGKNAYNNILHVFNGSNSNWATEVYYNHSSRGTSIKAGGVTTDFTCPFGTWFNVKYVIDLDNDNATFYIDDIEIVSWQFSLQSTGSAGNHQIAAMNFFPPENDTTSEFYIDNISVVRIKSTVGFTDGSICTLTAMAATGYTFVNWTENGEPVSESATYEFTVTGPRTLVANFEQSIFTHATSLSEGWNWYSSYIAYTPDALSVLESNISNTDAHSIIKSQSGFVGNESGQWMGSLNALDNTQMYMIQVDRSISIAMTGRLTKPSMYPITLTQGWTWMGYLSSVTMSLSEALSSLNPSEGDIIKGQSGFATYSSATGWVGSLNTLVPGNGYIYLNNGLDNMTLVYPSSSRGVVDDAGASCYWTTDTHRFRDNMTLMLSLDGEAFQLGDGSHEVAAFVDGECRGSARIQHLESVGLDLAFLTVNGTDGETVAFQVYDVDRNEVHEGVAREQLVFGTDDVYGSLRQPWMLHFSDAGNIPEVGLSASLEVAPNPVHRGETLRLVIPDYVGRLHVELYNVLGMRVGCMDTKTSWIVIDQNLSSGTYLLKVRTLSGKGYYGKIIVK